MSACATGISRTLLSDGSLQVDVDPALDPLVRDWMPDDTPEMSTAREHGIIRVRPAGARTSSPERPDPAEDVSRARTVRSSTLRLGAVRARTPERDRVHLQGRAPSSEGDVDLDGLRADLFARARDTTDNDPTRPPGDLYAMLTIASALLLGRLDRALVHSAAVVAPDGGAWLLLGDARAGKTTTTVNLISTGWGYLSDDQVVLRRDGRDGVWAEGWLRPFHLDTGWHTGRPTRVRRPVDARALAADARCRNARLSGLLFPRVDPDRPTALVPMTPADALSRLVRQTPWLLADRATAPRLLELLTRAGRRPAFLLRLGLDTFRDPELLRDRLAAVEGAR